MVRNLRQALIAANLQEGAEASHDGAEGGGGGAAHGGAGASVRQFSETYRAGEGHFARVLEKGLEEAKKPVQQTNPQRKKEKEPRLPSCSARS